MLNWHADHDGRLRRALEDAGLRVRVRERLLWSEDSPALAGLISIERALDGAVSALMPARRADALRQLLVEDPDAITVLTPDAAARLVRFIQRIDCARLLVGDERDAASCILRACATLSG